MHNTFSFPNDFDLLILYPFAPVQIVQTHTYTHKILFTEKEMTHTDILEAYFRLNCHIPLVKIRIRTFHIGNKCSGTYWIRIMNIMN